MWKSHIRRLSFDQMVFGVNGSPAHSSIVRKQRSCGQDPICPSNDRFAAWTTHPTPVDADELWVILGEKPFRVGHHSYATTEGFREFTESVDRSVSAKINSS